MSFQPDYIFDLEATERYSAIREILRRLIRVGAIPSHAEDSLFTSIRAREEVMSTGVGFGMAFPTAYSDIVTKRLVALGRLKSGVEFSSIDGKPVYLIGMMILPKSGEASTGA
jgi:mannitol/fructose-specific phosphotransferase system IIA component (Ntr-type)